MNTGVFLLDQSHKRKMLSIFQIFVFFDWGLFSKYHV